MTNLPHIPAIRRGRNYESLDKATLIDHRTGKELTSISQVNAGIIRKDLAYPPKTCSPFAPKLAKNS